MYPEHEAEIQKHIDNGITDYAIRPYLRKAITTKHETNAKNAIRKAMKLTMKKISVYQSAREKVEKLTHPREDFKTSREQRIPGFKDSLRISLNHLGVLIDHHKAIFKILKRANATLPRNVPTGRHFTG